MWPAKAINVAHETQNFVYLAHFFHEKIVFVCKNIKVLALAWDLCFTLNLDHNNVAYIKKFNQTTIKNFKTEFYIYKTKSFL
jgi:hypothetical protein